MNAILGFLKSFLAKGSSLFGLKSVIDSFFGKEPANKIVKSNLKKDNKFIERFFGRESASSPSDDAPDVFSPDPLMDVGGGTILPLDPIIPSIDSTPLRDNSLSSIVQQINKINSNIDAIRDAMLQTSLIQSAYRQKLIEDLEQKLADRGGERSSRRNERRKFNFLRDSARKFNQTKNTIAGNPFLKAVVGGVGLEILGNIFKNFQDPENKGESNDENGNKNGNGNGNGNENGNGGNGNGNGGNGNGGNGKIAFNPSSKGQVGGLPPFMYGAGSSEKFLTASTQPVSGMFNDSSPDNFTSKQENIANNFGDIDKNLSMINELIVGDTTNNFDGFSNVFNNNLGDNSSNMSFITSGTALTKSVESKSGITVLDLRSKTSTKLEDLGKSVPVFGSDVTSTEPPMGDWEIYLSRGSI